MQAATGPKANQFFAYHKKVPTARSAMPENQTMLTAVVKGKRTNRSAAEQSSSALATVVADWNQRNEVEEQTADDSEATTVKNKQKISLLKRTQSAGTAGLVVNMLDR